MTAVSSGARAAGGPAGVGAAQVGAAQVGPAQVGQAQVGAAQVGPVVVARKPPARRKSPTLRRERQLWPAFGGLLAAFDEVGRGALAGPVSVGVVLLAADTKPAPTGVADSKLLTPAERVRLAPRIRRWALDCAVGHSSPAEIDAFGLMAALRIAAERAVGQLSARPDWILLDGNHDYLTRRRAEPADPSLFDAPAAAPTTDWSCQVPVVTVIKGDMSCSSIAAASVLAKTERDAILVQLAEQHPQYGFDVNKAYSTPFHLRALSVHGPSEVHRRSWNLPLRERLTQAGADPAATEPAEIAMTARPSMGDDGQMSIAGVSV